MGRASKTPQKPVQRKSEASSRQGKTSTLEEALAWQMRAGKLPEPERQLRFARPRRWMFDFAWPDALVAIEVEGGIWAGGRHIRPAGFEKDCEKYNAAALLGWRVFRVTGKMIDDGRALLIAESALNDDEKQR